MAHDIAEDSSMPTATLPNWKLVKKPRRLGGADSARKSVAALYSPPTDSPCNMRSEVSRMGARMPMLEYVGKNAMISDEPAIARIVTIKPLRRPKRSENAPIPPTHS